MLEMDNFFPNRSADFTGQHLVEVEDIDLIAPERHLSALRALMDLTHSPRVSEIGLHRASNAAAVTEANENLAELNVYNTFFPRDAHIVAYFLRERFPHLTEATIMASLAYTGTEDNLKSASIKDEQEVWKVPHEIRDPARDPRAAELTLEKDWGWPYYGAIDTTGKNINAIAFVALQPGQLTFLEREYIGMDGQTHSVCEALQGHINWLRSRMDLNPEGLIEALWFNPKHHANQTWPDSPDSFHHADGAWARHHPDRNWGVAPLELQAETYDAFLNSIEVYRALTVHATDEQKQNLMREIEDLTRRATRLKEIVLTRFWVPDTEHFGGFFARGTDRDAQGNLWPLAIRTSDMGHLLTSKILDGNDPEVIEKREAVIKNLFSPEMLALSGIRTLSSDSLRYHPDTYHNGSVWPWVSCYVAKGLDRYGYHGLSYELKRRVWSLHDTTKIFPEYSQGSNDPDNRLITRRVIIADPSLGEQSIYQISQPAQEIQAWTVAAVLAMKYEHGNRVFKLPGAIPTRATDPQKRQFEESILSRLL